MSQSFNTPIGTFLWVGENGDLSTPSTKFDADNKKISLTLVVDKDGDGNNIGAEEFKSYMQSIVDAGIEQLASEEPNPQKKRAIFNNKRVPGIEELDDFGSPTGNIKFKFNTTRVPVLTDSEGNLIDPSCILIGNGSKGRCRIGVGRPYKVGNFSGVAFYLNEVQLTEHVMPPSASRNTLGKVEGGYVSPESSRISNENESKNRDYTDNKPSNPHWDESIEIKSSGIATVPPGSINMQQGSPLAEGVVDSDSLAKFTAALEGLKRD